MCESTLENSLMPHENWAFVSLLAVSLAVAGCSAEEDTSAATVDIAQTGMGEVAPSEVIEAESIGEAQEASTQGEACRAICAASYTAACLRVTTLCAGAEAITIGGATVACGTAIPVVCLSAAALGSICRGRCPP
jgi:hypothetical protein